MKRSSERHLRQSLMRRLRPEIKVLVMHIANSETKAALLSFLRRYTGMALTAADLALRIGRDMAAVERDLADLVILGVVDKQVASNLTFYRLTDDERKRAELDELVKWQQHWLDRATRLAQAVGSTLL